MVKNLTNTLQSAPMLTKIRKKSGLLSILKKISELNLSKFPKAKKSTSWLKLKTKIPEDATMANTDEPIKSKKFKAKNTISKQKEAHLHMATQIKALDKFHLFCIPIEERQNIFDFGKLLYF